MYFWEISLKPVMGVLGNKWIPSLKTESNLVFYKVHILRCVSVMASVVLAQVLAKFPHSPILHYACRSLLTENNGKNNAIAMGPCAVFVVSW